MFNIPILAGGFASVSKGMDSTVNLSLTYVPVQYIIAGLFSITGFFSTAPVAIITILLLIFLGTLGVVPKI